MVDINEQFASCSRDEIKSCIYRRINKLRELKDFYNQYPDIKSSYTHIKTALIFYELRVKFEIKYLFKRRHREKVKQ